MPKELAVSGSPESVTMTIHALLICARGFAEHCKSLTILQIHFGPEECGHTERVCSKELEDKGFEFPDICTFAVCVNDTGCTLQRYDDQYDECNVCYGDGTSCIIAPGQVAVLGGAVVAALVAAIVAVVLAVGAFGSKKVLLLAFHC